MKKFLLFFIPLWVMISCKSDELDFEKIKISNIQGEYAFPIGEVTYSMRELMDNVDDSSLELDSILVGQDSSSYMFVLGYGDTITYNSIDDLFSISDVDQRDTLRNLIPPGLTGALTFPIDPQLIEFTYENSQVNADDNEEIDEIVYSAGLIRVLVFSTKNLDYTITLNNTFEPGGNAVTFVGNTWSGENPNRDLNGYRTVIQRVNGENIFSVNFDAVLNLAAGETTTGDEDIKITVEYLNQEFEVVRGYFGQDTIALDSQTLALDFFQDFESEGFFFGDPQIIFDFTNEYGIPLGIDFSNVFVDNGEGTPAFQISGGVTRDLEVVSAATEPNVSESSTVTLSKRNSNIVDLFGQSPSRFIFNVGAISNPQGNDGTRNFITTQDQIEGIISVIIPMDIQLENVQQTGSLDLGDGIDTDQVDSAYLRIVTLNELPFEGELTLEILEIDTVNADTLVAYTSPEAIVLNTPFMNINGIVTDATGAVDDIPLNKQGLDALKNGYQIRLTIVLNTPGSLVSDDIFVKLLTDYKLQVKVGVGGKVDIEL